MLKIYEQLEQDIRNAINNHIDDVIFLVVDFNEIVEENHTEIFYTATVKSRYPLAALRSLLCLEEEGFLEGDDYERNITFQLTERGLDHIHGIFGWCGHDKINSWEVDFENTYIMFEID